MTLRAERSIGCVAHVYTAAALLLCVGGAAAQSIISVGGISDGGHSAVHAISRGGAVATGSAGDQSSRDMALRWKRGSGLKSLGLLPGGMTNTFGQAINKSGSVIAGFGDASGKTRSFRWSDAEGYQILPLIPGTQFATACGIDRAGVRVVGTSGIGTTARAFLWEEASPKMVLNLGTLSGQTSSSAQAISGDGTTIVGASGGFAFRWTAATGMMSLGSLPGQTSAIARSVSDVGSTIAGVWNDGNERGFKWTSTKGMQDLPLMPTGTVLRPRGISGDGALVVGQGNGTIGLGAFVHSDAMGTVDLASHLQARGVDLTGWQLTDCHAVDHSGSAFGGYGFFAGQSVGFVVSGLTTPSVTGNATQISAVTGDSISLPSHGADGATKGTALVYRWYRNGVLIANGEQPGGSVISDASSDPLEIQSLTASDTGTYWCVVSSQGASPVQGPRVSLSVAAASNELARVQCESGGGSNGVGSAHVASVMGRGRDRDGDGHVDFFDYLSVVGSFSESDVGVDFNGDTEIDFFDYLDFVAAFSMPC